VTQSAALFGKPPVSEASTKVVTEKLAVTFSDLGGTFHEIQLPTFKESTKKDALPITLVGPTISPFSLSTLFSDPALEIFKSGKYERSGEGKRVTYRAVTPSGIELEKEYKLPEHGYLVEMNYTFRFPEGSKRDWGYFAIPVGAHELKYDYNHPLQAWEAVVLQNDSVTRKTTQDLAGQENVMQGNTSWLAFGNRYFSTALVNGSEYNPDAVLLSDAQFSGGYLRYPLVLKEGQKALTYSVRMYAGPKDYNDLQAVPGLKQLIDYGMFAFLAYPLLSTLKFFYKFVHNYGIAIILLTILVRALFYPLSLKSYKSMKAMQKLQPQIQALKDKYGDDREKINREQIALFKAHKVNPAGGCLPMFVQLPVFIALYAVLGNSIDLFQAPFVGWIHDLSAKDPFYIFPVLMGLAMVVQQKITPMVGMDPVQQKMMLIMPVVFTFFMINLPSGLTLYMFVSTLLGILQQYTMTREPKTEAALVPTSAPEKG